MSNKHSQVQCQHLFFPNDDNFSRFCKKLKKCKSTFLGCIYQLTHSIIIETLVQLAKEGCRVDLIMDKNSDEQEERKKITIHMLLVMSGFKINISLVESKGLMHSKFCVIDNNITILGSANWTYQAFQNNFENITIIKDSTTAKQYTEQFRVIWDQAILAKFVDSQIIYQPNQNCVEFNKNKISHKFGIKKRQFKMKPKFRKFQKSLKQKIKEQKLQKVTPPSPSPSPQLKIQIKQNLPLIELQQIEEQNKVQIQNQNEIEEFLENLRSRDEKKQNYSDITIQNENKNCNAQFDQNPWQIKNQYQFPNITKHKQTQKQEQNIIIIDDEDVEEVQIIHDFSKQFL